ncbi:MAG: PhzF family phenazine biosynthesis protein [Planctomycetota bacterium]|nr:PhzF family phenazine biosynthesis protein [Planctomycetota bacterium]
MQLPFYQVDAFVTARPFSGNPAAVCPLDAWLDAPTMQAIAEENNLSETAFFVKRDDGGYDLRWFTPGREVDLCGHATLACGLIVQRFLAPEADDVTFHSRSGPLGVALDGDRLCLDFPAQPGTPRDCPEALVRGLGLEPKLVLAAPYTVCVLEDEATLRALRPDHAALLEVDAAVAVTAPGDDCDFVSRFFGRGYGIDEDPVTGSLHTTLAPYWAAELGRERLTAHQASARGGDLECTVLGERIAIAGRARLVIEGRLLLA